MLIHRVNSPGERTSADLRRALEDELRTVIEGRGVEAVVDESGVDRETVEALAAGESPTLDLSDAAAILATEEGAPDAETLVAEARDDLLLGMTTAVLDVDTLAANLDLDLSGKEVQQRIEGRAPMTLAEYAAVGGTIERRKR